MISFLINAIKIVFILGFLVFIHEGGHFIIAKLCKVKVNEFAIGFGPTIWSKQGKETKYALRLIPLGGFVVVLGDSLFIISYQVCFVKNFFHFFESFSLNRFCPICYLKRDNSDILSRVVLFVNNFFIFQKINNQVSFSRPSKSACLSQWTFILPLLSGYVNTFFLSIKNS